MQFIIFSDKKPASQPKKKSSARRHKAPLANGKVANGVTHLTNGSHSRVALKDEGSQNGSVGEPNGLLNGHHTGKKHESDGASRMKCFITEDSALASPSAPCDQIIC